MAKSGERRGWLFGMPKGGVYWFGRLLLVGAVGVPIGHFMSKPDFKQDAAYYSELFNINDTSERFLETAGEWDFSCASTPKGEATETRCTRWPQPRGYDILYMFDPDTKGIEITGTFVDGKKTRKYTTRVVDAKR
jgi:hypothetical protein